MHVQAEEKTRQAAGCTIDWVGHRGITLCQLRMFGRKAQRQLAKQKPQMRFEEAAAGSLELGEDYGLT